MANRLQHLRGSEAEHSTFTGAKGEISLVTDTSSDRIPTGEVRVHDGTTAGGLHVTGAARAWVNFNGTLNENSGSLTVGENVLIRASYNVSSVYFNTTGDYTINFENDMPDANYCAVATTKENDDTTTQTTVVMFHTQTPSSCRIYTVRANVSAINAQNVNVAIFR